jgi:hypothetical protein
MTVQLYSVSLLRKFVTWYKKRRRETHYAEGSHQLAWQDCHGFIWLRGRLTGLEIATCSQPGVDFSWVGGDPRTPEQIACAREVPAAISYGEEPGREPCPPECLPCRRSEGRVAMTQDGTPREAYRAFVERMLRVHSVSFHPDTPMTRYVYGLGLVTSGARVFSPAVAAELQAEHDALYGALEDGDDPYAIAIEVFQAFENER